MKKILIIDDTSEITDNIREYLELANYKAIVANNGKDGVELALSSNPDLVICDIMMPGMDGYGVLYALQKKQTNQGHTVHFFDFKSRKGRCEKRDGVRR
ncbi:MAG TPA: response regulator [Chitinophagaceae bacterium]|nr:response regulator [Chitinophagaceae bacterium]